MIDLELVKESKPIELKLEQNSTGTGTSDYNDLTNKPSINGKELQGNLTTEDLGIKSESLDVQVNGASIVTDGVANIPPASANLGLVKMYGNGGMGIFIDVNGGITTSKATNTELDNRNNGYKVITPSNLDYAVKQAMCDGKGAQWTIEEKAMARERMGLEWRYIGKVETQEEVSKIVISKDSLGNDFALNEVYFKVTIIGTETNSEVDMLRINVNDEVDTGYRIYDNTGGVQNASTKRRTVLVHAYALFNSIVGVANLPTSSSDSGPDRNDTGNCVNLRMPPRNIESITSITVYPKTSGMVFGVGSTLEIYGR